MIKWLGQLLCWHQFGVVIEPGSCMYLQCWKCFKRTAGWIVK